MSFNHIITIKGQSLIASSIVKRIITYDNISMVVKASEQLRLHIPHETEKLPNKEMLFFKVLNLL